jgi:tRNA pseudouridine55 synthase
MIFFNKSCNLSIPNIVEASENEGAVLLIDKPLNWTSFDVVAKIRSLTRIKKIGHAGTLDPLATGLLIVCIGRQATKNIDSFQNDRKKYEAIFKFGATTKTFDSEMEEENLIDTSELNIDKIKIVLQRYIGEIQQIPPVFSAKKIDGVAAYKKARKNIEVIMKPADVTIYNIEIIEFSNPHLRIIVECSKGTYIRSLANDIGMELKVGAYLSALRRTEIGNYNVCDAIQLIELIDATNKSQNSLS